MFAQVAVNVPQVHGVFDYNIPDELAGQIVSGCLVVVPFGKQTVQGVVLRLVEEASVQETKPIQALLDDQPVLTPLQLELADWLAEETLSQPAACMELMLPSGLSQQADSLFHRVESLPFGEKNAAPLSPTQERLLDLLAKRGDLRGRQVNHSFPHVDWRRASQGLIRRGLITSRPILLPPSTHLKTVRTAQLAVPLAEAEARFDSLGRGASLVRRQAVVRFLAGETLPVDVSWVYAASKATMVDLVRLAELGLVVLGESEAWRDPLDQVGDPNTLTNIQALPPRLTSAQQAAWEAVKAGIHAVLARQQVKPFLLHGVTGSGKTEIYLRAVEETLLLGRGAIILVPEISLTPQTVRRFMARFPGQVGLVHSRLSPGERYDTWRRVRDGRIKIIVGPRSALFSPLADIGLVVVDEFHDGSYFQDEIEPRYHAVKTALALGELGHAAVVLGSATPEVSWLYRARQESWPVLELPQRILAHTQEIAHRNQRDGAGINPSDPSAEAVLDTLPLPPIEVIDMRQELKAGNRSIFSNALREGLAYCLEAGEQSILFLNRRGKATYIFCRDCGYVLRCPRCDLPLTLHTVDEAGTSALICHTCNYRRQVPKNCPQCRSLHFRQFGTGTEKVAFEVQQLFPKARVLRWDYETTRQKGAHELLLSTFANHRADILVGTQMLAKGLDLPLVTLVGVVLADVGLNLPDFRAAERTFQLLVQVAGRSGRSALGGKAILQTFMPENYAIQAASNHDYAGFYDQELAYRRNLGYPPFSRLVRLEYRGMDAHQVEEQSRTMAALVQHWIDNGDFRATEIIGPVPCFFARVDGYSRWQILLRGPNPVQILRERIGINWRVRPELGNWRIEVDPLDLL